MQSLSVNHSAYMRLVLTKRCYRKNFPLRSKFAAERGVTAKQEFTGTWIDLSFRENYNMIPIVRKHDHVLDIPAFLFIKDVQNSWQLTETITQLLLRKNIA